MIFFLAATPRDGKWNSPQRSKFMECKDLVNWGILDTARTHKQELESFLRAIVKECENMGMRAEMPTLQEICRKEHEADKDFRRLYDEILNSSGKPPSIIMVICAIRNDIYRQVKLIGDTEYEMPTQVCLKKNLSSRKTGGPDQATMHNIVLKLNSKLGGTNQVLSPISKQDIFSNGKCLFKAPVS